MPTYHYWWHAEHVSPLDQSQRWLLRFSTGKHVNKTCGPHERLREIAEGSRERKRQSLRSR